MRKPGCPGAFNLPHYTGIAPRGRHSAPEYGKRPERNAPGVNGFEGRRRQLAEILHASYFHSDSYAARERLRLAPYA